ncbi:MAG: hypothetical protein R3296_02495 [Oleiphilaceae bacterium]|nr:hypothetical protein [Oleiphilaceae bacterium]
MAKDPEKRERARFDFMVDRDGEAAARAFAQRCLNQYAAAIREADAGGNQYGDVYRAELLASIRFYEQLLPEQ